MKRLTVIPIPHQALLEQATGVLAGHEIEVEQVKPTQPGDDGTRLTLAGLGRYKAVFRTHLTPKRAAVMADRLIAMKPPALLVADYVTAATAEVLRKRRIQFIDTAGNAYLYRERPRVHIWIEGRRPTLQRRRNRPTMAFRDKGLRVIFPLLCLGREARDATYRQIADWAGVALGTVANTIDDLEQAGYLRKTRKGLVLEQREKLLTRWVEEFPLELRPRLNPRRYMIENAGQWKVLHKQLDVKQDACLGGEAAAALLTTYLQPGTVTLYGRPDLKQLLPTIGPVTLDDAGPLEVVDRFWNFDVEPIRPDQGNLCPLLLIYADLMASGEGRQMETAGMLHEKYEF
jgi:hypothetical protein